MSCILLVWTLAEVKHAYVYKEKNNRKWTVNHLLLRALSGKWRACPAIIKEAYRHWLKYAKYTCTKKLVNIKQYFLENLVSYQISLLKEKVAPKSWFCCLCQKQVNIQLFHSPKFQLLKCPLSWRNSSWKKRLRRLTFWNCLGSKAMFMWRHSVWL